MTDRIVFGNVLYGRMIARYAGTHFNPECDVTIARERDGELMGGVVFQNYTGESIGIHSASFHPRWINRDLLWVTFDWPFRQAGVKRLFGLVPADNWCAIRFNTNLGFREIARIAGVYEGGVECVVMVMNKWECRFLDMKPRALIAKEASHGRQV